MKEKNIKESNIAGTWYPSDKNELNELITKFGNNVDKNLDKNIKGLIVPHAGYKYSGQVAMYGYKQLKEYKTVIVIAPSHNLRFDNCSILNVDYFKTPLGNVKVSPKVKGMLKEDIFKDIPEAYSKEHSLEIQLPFLQKVLKDFEVIPIITGDVNPEELSKVLIKYIDDKTLVVASSDLSHFHSYEEAVKMDKECINSILNFDFLNASECEMCGVIPVLTLMNIAKELNWNNEVLKYANSGDVTSEKKSVVGYASIAFFENENDLSFDEKKILLKLARDKLESLYSKKEVKIEGLTPKLREVKGCFVTLTENDDLRGCIGHIWPVEELYKCVMNNAVSAAMHDPRFEKVKKEELSDIKIEISVLTVPKKLEFKSSEDLLKKLKVGIDGVVLKKGMYQSTFLPQVWESLPDKEEFLTQLSLKAGLDADSWKDKNIEIYVYQVEKFSE